MTRSDVGWQDLKFKSGHKLYWQLFLQINKNNCLNFKEGENTQNQCVVKTLINLYGYDRRFYLVFLVSIFLCDLFLIWIKFHVMVPCSCRAAPLILDWRLSEGRRSSDKFNNKEAKADTEVITIISYQRAAVWLHHWLWRRELDDVSQVLEVTRGGFLFLPWLGNFEEVRRKRREREDVLIRVMTITWTLSCPVVASVFTKWDPIWLREIRQQLCRAMWCEIRLMRGWPTSHLLINHFSSLSSGPRSILKMFAKVIQWLENILCDQSFQLNGLWR